MTNDYGAGFDALGKLGIGGEIPIIPFDAGLLISRGRRGHIERIFPHFVLIFVREGTLYIEEEGRPFEVQAGQSLLLWPRRLHRGTRDYAPGLKFYWIHFDIESDGAGSWQLEVPQLSNVVRPDVVTELYRRFIKDQETGRLRPLSAALAIWTILAEVSDQRPLDPTNGPAILASRAYNHIRAHFREPLSATDIARALECNPQYLSRIFRQAYRQSIPETIRTARLTQAKELLMHTQHNVREVSRLSGFNDVSYFQRVFKDEEGITPMQYQKSRKPVKAIR